MDKGNRDHNKKYLNKTISSLSCLKNVGLIRTMKLTETYVKPIDDLRERTLVYIGVRQRVL